MEVPVDQLKRCGAAAAVFFTLAMAGCGGSPSGATETPQTVQGVTTPSSVSVVTATNAN